MTVTISDDKTNHEYYNVPNKVSKALIVLLDECSNDETEITRTESEMDNIKNKYCENCISKNRSGNDIVCRYCYLKPILKPTLFFKKGRYE